MGANICLRRGHWDEKENDVHCALGLIKRERAYLDSCRITSGTPFKT
jgi:hypothetical protein